MENQPSEAQNAIQEGQIVQRDFAQGSLTGEFVKNLTDKHFTIISQRTEMVRDLDNSGQLKEKCILKVKLTDSTEVDYYPNKTSIQVIINKKGFAYKNWIGYVGEFFTIQQKVGKDMKEVIYLEE
jgi:hypothetical protein